ncbi:response regulator transcription factor [Lysobacter auxotrophicus]|uniref:Response regulator transcription factor n=1 Tax=Lysobacter auxotrophicus TaxID=2992573 RepID=A0ABN6UV66_9GAMM|nr:response regulator transcription factor [Lysobacter auxotrophicus]BDU18118.1 response regulator transcription factor [Lysobacter auxotrophicus]
MRALLVEDEPELAMLVSRELEAQGLSVDAVPSLTAASGALLVGTYAILLLDRRLPDGDGLRLVPLIRAKQPECSVLVISALGDVAQRVAGLDAGADDYIGKPFHVDELRARVRALLRRPARLQKLAPVRCGALEFDLTSRQFSVSGTPFILRRREAALLAALMRRARRVVQRDTLIREVYGFDEEPSQNTLEAHISRLRKKLDSNLAGVVVHPVRGVGYFIDDRQC